MECLAWHVVVGGLVRTVRGWLWIDGLPFVGSIPAAYGKDGRDFTPLQSGREWRLNPLKQQAMVIMAKQPHPGRTKTRLCPPLTAEQAAELYQCFLHDIIGTVRDATQNQPDIAPYIAFAPLSAADYFQQLAPAFGLLPQVGERLNERLQSVFDFCFEQGFQQVAAINSDSPTLPEAYLIEGFERLKTADVVLGPCEDGGYYLIGMKRPIPEIILPVKMSTEKVLHTTLGLIEANGLTVELLPTWYDVDRIEDLERLKGEMDGSNSQTAAWLASW